MRKFKNLAITSLALVLSLVMVACNTGGTDKTDPAGTGTSTPASSEEPASSESGTPAESEGQTGLSGEAKLTVWTPAEDQADVSGQWIQTLAKKFQEANPNLNVTFEFGIASEADAKTQVLNDVDSAADVFMYANDQLGELVDGGGLARLGGDAEKFVRENMSETYVNSVTREGALYGIPFAPNTWYMYYDKSVFSEDDVKSLETMLEKGKVTFPLKNSWYNASFFVAGGAEFFGPTQSDNDAGIVLGDNKVEVGKYLVNLVNNPNFVKANDDQIITFATEGTVNAFFSGSWDANNAKEAFGDNLGAAQLPTINLNGEVVQLKSFAGSKAIGVNPKSDNLPVAIAFAQFISSPEAQQSHYDLRGIVPTHNEVGAKVQEAGSPIVAAEIAVMSNTSIAQPLVSGMGNWWTPAQQFGEALWEGNVTLDNVEEYVNSLQQQINGSDLG